MAEPDTAHVAPPSALRVAVWQCAPKRRDPEANLARLDAVAAIAADRGADLLVTPELALTGYDVGDLDGLLRDDDLDRVGAVARRHDVALVVGLALPEPDLVPAASNAAVIVDAEGCHLATYRKAHLFGDLDASRFAAGTSTFAIATVGGTRVATMICYDVEFPEAVRAAALAGARLLAVPTANMHPYEIVCEQVVPVRAWENQIAVAYANHCGSEGDTAYVGRSVVVGPDGRPLARAGPDGEEVLVADVDLAAVASGRLANPYLTDRRPEIYDVTPDTDTDTA